MKKYLIIVLGSVVMAGCSDIHSFHFECSDEDKNRLQAMYTTCVEVTQHSSRCTQDVNEMKRTFCSKNRIN